MSFKRALIFIMLAATLLTSAVLTNAQEALTAAGEYSGTLEALNDSQLTVSGLTFDVSDVTPDDDEVWEPGLLVEVSFTASGGLLSATYVDVVEEDENGAGGYLVGTLEAVSAESVTVGGLTFGVASDGFDEDVIYEVGLTVEIEFGFSEGLFTASSVWVWDAPEEDDASEDEESFVSEIYGVVEALDDTTIVVSGTSFDITTAEISGLVEVGAWVELGFITAEDGTAEAVYVAGEDDDIDTPDEDEDEQPYLTLTGILESYEGSTMVVSGVTIDVSFAVIDNDDDLVIGGYVTVIFDDVNDEVVAIFVIPQGSEDDGSEDDGSEDDNGDNGDEDDGSEDDDSSDVCEDPSGWYSYEVNSGDTLSSIAAAAGITLEALMTANCLTDANMISVGYELYTPVELSSGDVDNGGDEDGGDEDGGDEDGGDEDGGSDDGGGEEDN